METISYVGERLWAGHLGNGFVVLSFVAALLSCVSYYLSFKNPAYLRLARISFNIHSAAVLGIAGTLFYMLFNHFFEYQYVWQHSNTDMNMKYILSCFWEGQEGSFLLWTFWNVVLGLVLKRQLRGVEWEMPVMTVFALVQVFLASMILGIYVFDYRIGSNAFLLLREHPDFMDMPFVQNANYLERLNGRGLNPLLMNYWMTIHPPTLFLGFSATLVPFAFAIGAFWNRKYNDWQKIALPWTYFGILVLGVGILMGGAWAYEALSFGGFWAWDPVENSSLVPWLVLVAAGHTMIINRHRGGSLFITHFLAICSFLLVLYSTFLTRSGVLGNASVHAFTDLGMTGQLVLYVLTFIFISVVLLIYNRLFRTSYVVVSLLMLFAAQLYGHARILLMVWLAGSAIITAVSYALYFPREKEEEDFYSREFWMFLGSLVLILSGLIITYFTSIPVINKLFNTEFAPPKVPVYNTWMLPFSVVLLVLMAGAQFLKYRKTSPGAFYRRISYSFLLALLFGIVCSLPLYFLNDFAAASVSQKWTYAGYSLLLVSGFFAAFANGDYWVLMLKGRISRGGASIAHIGFALILCGALVSTSKKIVLSKNTSERKIEGLNINEQESIVLTKGDTLPMGPYLVSYKGKRKEGMDVYFEVDYMTQSAGKKPEYAFTLVPKVQDNPRMGKAADPSTRHFLNRDIYTHVTYADLNIDTAANAASGFASAKNFVGHVGDTIFASNALVVIDSLRTNIGEREFARNDSLLEVTAVLRCIDVKGRQVFAYPKFVIRNNVIIPVEDVVEGLGLKFMFWKINPEEGTIEITLSEKLSNNKDFIVMEAYVFPYINVLWLGCVVMALGTIIAIVTRIRKFRDQTA